MESVVTTPLAEFLTLPNIEASPAWEFVHGIALQKPMPTLFNSRLQRNLVNYINEHSKQFEAVQELRCVVPLIRQFPIFLLLLAIDFRKKIAHSMVRQIG